MNTTTFHSSSLDLGPVVSRLFATLGEGLRRFGRGVWDAMEAHGRAQAVPRLLAVADRVAVSDPELAARIRQSAAHLG